MANNQNKPILKDGSMDIQAQVKTYNGFIQTMKWSAIICVIALIFMALANG